MCNAVDETSDSNRRHSAVRDLIDKLSIALSLEAVVEGSGFSFLSTVLSLEAVVEGSVISSLPS